MKRKKPFIGGKQITKEEAYRGLGDPATWEADKKRLMKKLNAKPKKEKMKYKTLQELYKQKSNWTQGLSVKCKKPNILGGDINDARKNPEKFCFCLVGGIRLIYGTKNDEVEQQIWNKVRDTIRFLYPREEGFLWEIAIWNDDKKRTIKDIRKVVKLANV
jgi:hypothetical protein